MDGVALYTYGGCLQPSPADREEPHGRQARWNHKKLALYQLPGQAPSATHPARFASQRRQAPRILREDAFRRRDRAKHPVLTSPLRFSLMLRFMVVRFMLGLGLPRRAVMTILPAPFAAELIDLRVCRRSLAETPISGRMPGMRKPVAATRMSKGTSNGRPRAHSVVSP